MKIDELKELLEQQKSEVKDLSAVNDLLDEVIGEEVEEETVEEEKPEEATEEDAEETAEEATEEPEEVEEEVAEEAEETSDETPDEGDALETVELSVVLEGWEAMKAELASLKAQLAEVKSEKEEAEKKLSAKVTAEQEFLKKFKTLTAVVADEKKPVEMPTIGMTNGIGEG